MFTCKRDNKLKNWFCFVTISKNINFWCTNKSKQKHHARLYSNYSPFCLAIQTTKPSTTENFTLLSVSRLAEHVTHDVMFGGLAVPQTIHSSLSASRKLACGTFCGCSGASHIRQFGAFRGTIPLQLTHGPTYHTSEFFQS